jgi:hypothetical protein
MHGHLRRRKRKMRRRRRQQLGGPMTKLTKSSMAIS